MSFDTRSALMTHLSQLDIGMPYRFENVESSASSALGYAEVYLHRFPSDRPYLGPKDKESGFLQVSLLGRQGDGTKTLEQKAQLIQAHFPADLKLPVADPSIRVTKKPDIGDGFPDGPTWHVPVTIYYETWN